MPLFSFRLLVSNFGASVTFWREVIGLSLAYSDETMGYAYFETGSAGLELYSRDGFASALGEVRSAPAEGRQAVVTFKVEDVDATFADLVKRGAQPIANPKDRPQWRARTGHLADPDGYLVEIYSSLDASEVPTA